MICARLTVLAVSLALLAGCQPDLNSAGSAPPGASQADYERHKANRKAYLYQGL